MGYEMPVVGGVCFLYASYQDQTHQTQISYLHDVGKLLIFLL